jgi:CubicO group peptidase (beta-lactamase class C family)
VKTVFGFRALSLTLIVASAIALIAPSSRAADEPTTDDAIAAIQAFGQRALTEQGAPGMSVTITDRTHTLRVLTFGYSNADAKTMVTPQTRFVVYSITKSFVALALLRQHDAGRLDLQAPVQRYLPWFSINSGGKPILIHQLLSHTSGLPTSYGPDGGTFGVAELRHTHVLFPPGTSWSYANAGYELWQTC